jgi:hypothetical protein
MEEGTLFQNYGIERIHHPKLFRGEIITTGGTTSKFPIDYPASTGFNQ